MLYFGSLSFIIIYLLRSLSGLFSLTDQGGSVVQRIRHWVRSQETWVLLPSQPWTCGVMLDKSLPCPLPVSPPNPGLSCLFRIEALQDSDCLSLCFCTEPDALGSRPLAGSLCATIIQIIESNKNTVSFWALSLSTEWGDGVRSRRAYIQTPFSLCLMHQTSDHQLSIPPASAAP